MNKLTVAMLAAVAVLDSSAFARGDLQEKEEELSQIQKAASNLRGSAQFRSYLDFYGNAFFLDDESIDDDPLLKMLDEKKALWLQGRSGTCVRQAIALNLTVNGQLTTGQEVVEAARPFVERDILLLGNGTPMWGGQVHAPQLALLEIKKKLLLRQGVKRSNELHQIDQKILRMINSVGMHADNRALAKTLNYGIRTLGSKLWAFQMAWMGLGKAQDRFFEGSKKLKEIIKKELENGAVLVRISIGKSGRPYGGFHAINVVGTGYNEGEELAILFDSNFGLLAIPWDDFYPIAAWVLSPNQKASLESSS